ncbi:diphosphate--fructose-6-phosphate 1-phosphotransferase [Thermoproteota archaeon]
MSKAESSVDSINTELEKILTGMEKHNSPLEKALRKLPLSKADVFFDLEPGSMTAFKPTDTSLKGSDFEIIEKTFPKTLKKHQNKVLTIQGAVKEVQDKRVAVLFSGGPAAGGHNVLLGLKKGLGPYNTLYGVRSGPQGLMAGDLFELEQEALNSVANLGGFDLLGSARTKITSKEQYEAVKAVVREYKLDGIVIIGGDDSNTNAAFLAEYLFEMGCSVIGIPKTIDGDLQAGKLLPISFGFDTAARIYAELVGNILQDTPSSRKYWHFIKLMGRSASHVTLEVALKTRPPIALISEEISGRKMSLNDVVEYVAGIIAYRAGKGINHGVIIVPEGLIEFVPEFTMLINELDDALAGIQAEVSSMSLQQKLAYIKLSLKSAELLGSLPIDIQSKLVMDRDAHGNLQVSQIPTEQLLIMMTEAKIAEMKFEPQRFFGKGKIELAKEEIKRFKAFKFAANHHFFGYEGRCGAPSRFDALYTYNLGLIAASLILNGHTGYMASLNNLEKGWKALAVPLTGLLNREHRSGEDRLVIKKALVELDSPAFRYFEKRRQTWAKKDVFTNPGPRQFFGETCCTMPFTVALNQGYSSIEFKIE